MKNLQSIWFTEIGGINPIGIVIGEDTITEKRKAYIGTGLGHNEEEDTKIIAERGAKVSPRILKFILKRLEENNKEKR